MYVCGKENRPTPIDRPSYQLSFDANGILNGVGAPQLAGVPCGSRAAEACSPVTEIYNSTAATDWIFFSIGDRVNTAPLHPRHTCWQQLQRTANMAASYRLT